MNLEENTDLKKNPFKLPDGYWDDLKKEIMASLPDIDYQANITTPRHSFLYNKHIRPALYLAAAFCGLLFTISIYQRQQHLNKAQQLQARNISVLESDKMLNDFCDYARIDQNDIYTYLSENK